MAGCIDGSCVVVCADSDTHRDRKDASGLAAVIVFYCSLWEARGLWERIACKELRARSCFVVE